ncbi:MAG TPA: hypothetical protein VLW44_20740 [Streptosporangiaceae bacterium]|nr:hypothetical protein [Streptosporangiaceae bacterium]
MPVIILIIGFGIGAAVGWWRGLARADAAIARARAAMAHETRHWQDAAARATAEAARVAREAQTWAAGCRQGRDDVISIVPLLMAAHERPAGGHLTAADSSDSG